MKNATRKMMMMIIIINIDRIPYDGKDSKGQRRTKKKIYIKYTRNKHKERKSCVREFNLEIFSIFKFPPFFHYSFDLENRV